MKQHQHYVPRFYLNHFTKHGSGRLIAYRRDGPPILGTVNNFCGENEFYSIVDEDGELNRSIEDMFSRFESQWSKALNRLIAIEDTAGLSAGERVDLAFFVTFMWTRGRRFREHQKNWYDVVSRVMFKGLAMTEESLKSQFRDSDHGISDEEIRDLRETILEDRYSIEHTEEYWLKQSIYMAIQILPYVYDKRHWQLAKVEFPNMLITSDNPVSLLKTPDIPKWRGVGVENAVICLPLTPGYCLLMHNYDNLVEYSKSLGFSKVRLINREQMFYAYRFVFSGLYLADISRQFRETIEGDGERVIVAGPEQLLPKEGMKNAVLRPWKYKVRPRGED